MKKTLLSIIAMLLTVSAFAQWVISGGNAAISNTGNPTQVVVGSTTTGKTYGVFATSQDANGYVDIRAVKASGSTYGDLVLNPSGGNVGIGTTGPAEKLHISTTGSSPQFVISQNNWSSSGAHWYLQSVNGKFYIGNATNGGGAYSSLSDRIIIDNTGNVGIGTADTKGYTLAVNGSAIATSMKVKPYGSWPDYVFQPTYNLPTLIEVKAYIEKNSHLPDMPSAQEVEKDGLDLGEINKSLTKKVEELTLYLIEKDQQVDEQQKQIHSQQKQANDQQEKLKTQEERITRLEKALLK